MSITAIVENDTIKLPPGVHVPDGTKAEVVLSPTVAKPRTPEEIRRYLEQRPLPGGPASLETGPDLVGYGRGDV